MNVGRVPRRVMPGVRQYRPAGRNNERRNENEKKLLAALATGLLMVLGWNNVSFALTISTFNDVHVPINGDKVQRTSIETDVGDFANTERFQVTKSWANSDGTYTEISSNDLVDEFTSFIAIKDFNGGKITNIGGWPNKTITRSVYLFGIRETMSTVILKDANNNDILGLDYRTGLSDAVPDPTIQFGGAKWNIYVTLTNLRTNNAGTGIPLSLKYFWYLDFDSSGEHGNEYTRITTIPGGYQAAFMDQTGGGVSYFIDTFSPTRWDVETLSEGDYLRFALDGNNNYGYNLDSQSLYSIVQGDQRVAFQHDINLRPAGVAYLDLSPASSTPVPEPATMLLMGTGLAGLLGARRKKKQ